MTKSQIKRFEALSPIVGGLFPIQVRVLPALQDADGNPSYGMFDALSQTIILHADPTVECSAWTLLHELLHAIVNDRGRSLHPLTRHNWEEPVVETFAAGLFVLFRNNPALLSLLQWAIKTNKPQETE